MKTVSNLEAGKFFAYDLCYDESERPFVMKYIEITIKIIVGFSKDEL